MSVNPYAAPQTEVTPLPKFVPGERTSPYGPYRDIDWLHKTLIVLFAINIFVACGEIYAAKRMNYGLQIMDEDGDYETIIGIAEQLSQTFNLAGIVALITTVIFWGIWKNKSCKNAWFFRSQAPLNHFIAYPPTPGISVGYYFIPILSLWKPFQAMTFIRDQVADYVKTGYLLGFWWTSWLAWQFILRSNRTTDDEFETVAEAVAYNNSLANESITMIVASLFAVSVINQLSVGQRRKARAMGAL